MEPESIDISIIVPAYNATGTLEACIRSLQAQTHPNCEIIIIDDVSRDNTLEVARKLQQEDGRIVVIARETNGGPGGARNTGLDAARGTWISIVDSDDKILPGRHAFLLRKAQETGADIIFDNLFYYAPQETTPITYLPVDSGIFGSLTLARYIESHRGSCPIPNLGFLKPFIRRELLEKHHIRYQPHLRIGEDAMLIMTLFANGATAYLCKDAFYEYQRHEGSISFKQDSRSVRAINAAFGEFLNTYAAAIPQDATAIMRTLMDDNTKRIGAKETMETLESKGFLPALRLACRSSLTLKFFIREMLRRTASGIQPGKRR